jgi:hypothetical protein
MLPISYAPRIWTARIRGRGSETSASFLRSSNPRTILARKIGFDRPPVRAKLLNESRRIRPVEQIVRSLSSFPITKSARSLGRATAVSRAVRQDETGCSIQLRLAENSDTRSDDEGANAVAVFWSPFHVPGGQPVPASKARWDRLLSEPLMP